MDFLGWFSRHVYQSLLYRRWGLINVPAWEKRAQTIEQLSPTELCQYQMAATEKLIRYAYDHCPYYRHCIDSTAMRITGPLDMEELRKFPILTKEIVRQNIRELVTNDQNLQGVQQNMTGGSTGTPLIFYQDAEYRSAAIGIERRILDWWGVRSGDRTTAFWGADRELHDWSIKERMMMWLDRTNIFDSFSMSEEKMSLFAKQLSIWRPIYIKGYASSLHLFAKFLLAHPEYRINPIAVRSTAETLFEWQRADIEKAFGCKVYNFYGSREVNNIAAECPHQTGMHILTGTRIVELVNAKGEPVSPGEIGRIIVTDLVNRALPFIRYENGDLGVWAEDDCPCGRPYPLLRQVIGRVSDILVGENGKLVHGEFITHLFYGVPGIINFQVIQHSLSKLELIIHQDTKGPPPVFEAIFNKIRDRLGAIEIVVNATNESFGRTSSGKHRFVISHISPFVQQRNVSK